MTSAKLTSIWNLTDEQLNDIAPMHSYLGAGQFDAAYNPHRHAFAKVLSEEMTGVHYRWNGDFDATAGALRNAGITYREVMGVCWVEDFAAAKLAVEALEETKSDNATLVEIDL
jgi:hypothetical protein